MLLLSTIRSLVVAFLNEKEERKDAAADFVEGVVRERWKKEAAY